MKNCSAWFQRRIGHTGYGFEARDNGRRQAMQAESYSQYL
jgi:hypothetical protein